MKFLFGALLLICVSASSLAADLILTNAKVYSFAWPQPAPDGTPHADAPLIDGRWVPDAEALVIEGGNITFVGSSKQAKAYADAKTRVIDLSQAVVLPGLVDSHVHIAELGQLLSQTNLIGVETPQKVVNKLLSDNSERAENEWILGQGWDEGAWANQYPTRKLLDQAFPNNPVYLKSLHGFAVWVNSAALKAANITATTQAPVGGEIIRLADGSPSGILLNRATTLMQEAVPEPGAEEFVRQIELGLQRMAKDGYVAVHQAGAESRHIDAFNTLRQQQRLPIRMYAMLSARDEALAQKWAESGPHIDPQGMLDVRSVKAYYDGALGSRGARLLEDYSDQPGHRGVSGEGYGFDGKIVRQLIDSGFQIGIHAIGDAGNRETLDFLEAAFEANPESRALRHRVEHAQVIHADDLQRFKQLGLVASMEPPHAVEDKSWAEARLGADRVKGAYAWRSLRLAGVDLTFNSDLPGSDHDIFYGLHAAVTRRDKNAQPDQGWQPQEVVTMEEAIRAYTGWAAFSSFREQQTGVLEPGRWADLTVINIDPFEAAGEAPEKLLSGNVLMTIANGKIVFDGLNP